MTDIPVAGKPVCLLTRPAHQSEQITRLLEQQGYLVVNFPTIQIIASPTTEFLSSLQQHISQFDIALFVSRNAVDYAFNYLQTDALPAALQFGVIGKGSWQALSEKDVQSQIIPATTYDSEGLLASDVLQQVSGKRIIIFRGQEGRNLLGDTLRERGAEVEYCEVYRRELPEYSTDHFNHLTQTNYPHIAVFTSAEGLRNCFKLLDQSQSSALCNIDWVLISERMRETALELGHNASIIIATKASDEGILQSIQEWQKTRR